MINISSPLCGNGKLLLRSCILAPNRFLRSPLDSKLTHNAHCAKTIVVVLILILILIIIINIISIIIIILVLSIVRCKLARTIFSRRTTPCRKTSCNLASETTSADAESLKWLAGMKWLPRK